MTTRHTAEIRAAARQELQHAPAVWITAAVLHV